MIYGFIHPGSGLGNQLHRYIATRVLALDKGYEFSMIGRENFKGKSFMDLDFGSENDIKYEIKCPEGRIIPEHEIWEEKTNYYNPEFNFISDGTVIDGEFQSIQYFGSYLNDIEKWLKVEPMKVNDHVCAIGFRGGEFALFPELFLTKDYWDEAISQMQKWGVKKFEVHTDDEELAKKYFPDLKVIHDIGVNWRSMKYYTHAIIANSSFYILPRLLSAGVTIAPRYWARRNIKEWSRPDNYYPQFHYI